MKKRAEKSEKLKKFMKEGQGIVEDSMIVFFENFGINFDLNKETYSFGIIEEMSEGPESSDF